MCYFYIPILYLQYSKHFLRNFHHISHQQLYNSSFYFHYIQQHITYYQSIYLNHLHNYIHLHLVQLEGNSFQYFKYHKFNTQLIQLNNNTTHVNHKYHCNKYNLLYIYLDRNTHSFYINYLFYKEIHLQWHHLIYIKFH